MRQMPTANRLIPRGITVDLPALKPRQPASAVDAALDLGISFISRLCPTPQRSKKAVRTTPGARQVTVTPVPAVSSDSAAENEFTNAFEA